MNRIIDPALMHPRDQITAVISRIYKRGLTTTSGGNISIIDSNGDMWVTPSAVDKGSLQPSDIICVTKEGTIIGNHKPSSEYPFHKAIYEIRPDIKAIVHAHPSALVAFSIVHQIPDTRIIGQARICCGETGYAGYELTGSEALGVTISDEFRKGYNSVIMENHGAVVGGNDMLDAYQRFETLEFCARTILNSKSIGTPSYLSDDQIESFRNQVPPLMPEQTHTDHPSDELEKRNEICRIVHRACDQGLMISSYGTVSVRWHDNDFLITPRDIPRWNILPEDIVQIRDGKRQKGMVPSRSAWLHQEIYRKNPDINSIIITQSPYLMAFAATCQQLDVRTIPESWIFLHDVPSVPFGAQFFGNNAIPDLFSTIISAVLIQNDSFIVTGDKLLQTFDHLEVAEFSAQSLIMAKPIGKLIPISDEKVEELRNVFLKN